MPFMHSCNLTISAQKEQACATQNYMYIDEISLQLYQLIILPKDFHSVRMIIQSSLELKAQLVTSLSIVLLSVMYLLLLQNHSANFHQKFGTNHLWVKRKSFIQKPSENKRLETAVTWLRRKHYTINQSINQSSLEGTFKATFAKKLSFFLHIYKICMIYMINRHAYPFIV